MAYNGFLTNLGRSILAASNGNSDRLIIDKMGVGDSAVAPTASSLTLGNEIYKANVLSVVVVDDIFTVKFSVPATVLSAGNGFTVREIGIYGHLESAPGADTLLAAAEFPESYKPNYVDEGAAKSFIIEAKFLVLNNLAANIQPFMDPNVAYVSEEDLGGYYTKGEADVLIAEVADQCYNNGVDRYTKAESDAIISEYTKTEDIDELITDEIIENLHTMEFEAGEDLQAGDPVKIKVVKNDIGEYRPVVVKSKVVLSEYEELYKWDTDKVVTTNNVTTYYNEEDNKFFIAYGEVLSKEFRLDYFEMVSDPVDGDIFVKRDRWVISDASDVDTPVLLGNEFRNLNILFTPNLNRYVLFFDYNPYLNKTSSDMATTLSYWKSLVFFTNDATKLFETTTPQTLTGPSNTPMNIDDWGVYIVRKKCYAVSTDNDHIMISNEMHDDVGTFPYDKINNYTMVMTAKINEASNTISMIDSEVIDDVIITSIDYVSVNKFICAYVNVPEWEKEKLALSRNILLDDHTIPGNMGAGYYLGIITNSKSVVEKHVDSKYKVGFYIDL